MRIAKPRHRARTVFLAVMVLGLLGCGGSGIEKIQVSGTVTYQGQPIPYGKVMFQPDRTQGNFGPMGVALIENGRFESRSDRGIVPGALKVTVYGHNGKNRDPEYRPYGDPMFEPYTTTLNLTETTEEEIIDVP